MSYYRPAESNSMNPIAVAARSGLLATMFTLAAPALFAEHATPAAAPQKVATVESASDVKKQAVFPDQVFPVLR